MKVRLSALALPTCVVLVLAALIVSACLDFAAPLSGSGLDKPIHAPPPVDTSGGGGHLETTRESSPLVAPLGEGGVAICRGLVLDAVSGEPLSAAIRVSDATHHSSPITGAFVFETRLGVKSEVSVDAEGYEPEMINIGALCGTGVCRVLLRGSSMSVQVIDVLGSPVSGAAVLRILESETQQGQTLLKPLGRTSSDGRLTVHGGRMVLLFAENGAQCSPVKLVRQGSMEACLQLSQFLHSVGVRDSAGKGVAGVSVTLRGLDPLSPVVIRTQTDAAGLLALQVPASTYEVTARTAGGATLLFSRGGYTESLGAALAVTQIALYGTPSEPRWLAVVESEGFMLRLSGSDGQPIHSAVLAAEAVEELIPTQDTWVSVGVDRELVSYAGLINASAVLTPGLKALRRLRLKITARGFEDFYIEDPFLRLSTSALDVVMSELPKLKAVLLVDNRPMATGVDIALRGIGHAQWQLATVSAGGHIEFHGIEGQGVTLRLGSSDGPEIGRFVASKSVERVNVSAAGSIIVKTRMSSAYVSCARGAWIAPVRLLQKGVALFENLPPGEYCVGSKSEIAAYRSALAWGQKFETIVLGDGENRVLHLESTGADLAGSCRITDTRAAFSRVAMMGAGDQPWPVFLCAGSDWATVGQGGAFRLRDASPGCWVGYAICSDGGLVIPYGCFRAEDCPDIHVRKVEFANFAPELDAFGAVEPVGNKLPLISGSSRFGICGQRTVYLPSAIQLIRVDSRSGAWNLSASFAGRHGDVRVTLERNEGGDCLAVSDI
jgi:hypothetical protein